MLSIGDDCGTSTLPPRAGHTSLRECYLQSAWPRAMGCGRSDLLGLRKDGSVFPVEINNGAATRLAH